MGLAYLPQPRSLIVPRRGFRKPARPIFDPSDPINRGLVGCWLLGDSAVGLAKDVGPFGVNGLIVSTPALAASHHGGMSLSFNGSTSYVSLASVPQLTNPAITLVCWVKFSSLSPAYSGVISRNDNSGHYYQLLIKSSGKIAIYTTPAFYDGSGSFTLSTGQWYLIGFSYDPAGGLTGFVNAKVDGTAAAGGSLPSIPAITSIGADTVSAGRYAFVQIDGVRQYRRSLTRAEWLRLYAEPYAGIYEAGPRSRVGIASGGGFTAVNRRTLGPRVGSRSAY